jgi:AraC family transcriptional regulator, transcriptional activator of pobA
MFNAAYNMLSLPTAILETEIRDSFSIQKLACHSYPEETRLLYHRIILVVSGSGQIQIDDQQYYVTGHQLLLLSKGQIFRGIDLQVTGYEISFGDCFWERSPQSANNCKAVLFNNASTNQQLPLDEKVFAQLCPLFDILRVEHNSPDYINKLDVMAAYLKIIMIKIANINAALIDGYNDQEKQLYRQFIEMVSQQYQQLHDVAHYAKLLHVTPRRLSDICKSCSGTGAKQIINGQLIAEAKRNLQFSAAPIKEIAYQLHFSTPEQFSNFFKKIVSASPSDYRSSFVNIGR